MIDLMHNRLYKLTCLSISFLIAMALGIQAPPHLTGNEMVGETDPYCTQSAIQVVYTSDNSRTITTYKAPFISGKSIYIHSVDNNGDSIQSQLSTKDISLILDQESEIPGFIVFNKKGKPYCSLEMGLLDIPDHFSYRCLTKDRKVITAGIIKSQPINPLGSVRKLVNDNINKENIDVILKDNIVIECYKTSNWLGAVYTINVNGSPSELDYYKNDIVAMLKQDYAKMENTTQLEETLDDAEDSEEIEEAPAAPLDEIPTTSEVLTDESESDDTPAEADVELEDSEPESVPAVEAELATEDLDEPEPSSKNLGTRVAPPRLDDVMSAEDKDAIQKEAEEKLYRLQDCFVMLVNRNYSAQQKERQRETTVQDLFINERANVGVSSVNSELITNYPIGDYLLRLERMITGAYQKVEIVFSEIYRVANFKPNPDGTWSATVTFSQQFRGFKDVDGRETSYSDITQKNVTVRIRRVELFTGNSTPDIYWEVLLADIGVNQTESF